jgi:hypothetical protein
MPRMSVLYFTIEDLSSGLFNAQVFGNLKSLKKAEPTIGITLLAINRPWKWSTHRKIIKELKNSNINVIYIPLLPPMRWFSSSQLITPLYVNYLALLVALFGKVEKFDIIHCRHYLTSMILCKLGINNFLFDVRSLHVFEYVQAKKIELYSKNYYYWLNNEKMLLQNAKAVSVVSKSMIPYFRNVVDRSVFYCPIIGNFETIRFEIAERNRIRCDLGWKNHRVYVYSGSFGLYGLNKEYLAKMVLLIKKYDQNAAFLFLISNPLKEVQIFMEEYGIDRASFFCTSVGYHDLYKYLSAADVGIHSLPSQIDAFTRLGTKVVEYWTAGLPILINNNIGEAATIAKEFGLGEIIDLNQNYSEEQFTTILARIDLLNKATIRESAMSIFDSMVVAKSYLNIYKSSRIRTSNY